MGKFSDDFIQYSNKKVKDETKNLTLYFITHITLYIVLLFFVIFFAWYTVFVTTHKFYAVYGPSMMSTLNSQIKPNEIAVSRKTSYDAVYVDTLTKPKAFDIVVVERPNSDSVIKRLMAVEGDYITIAKGKTESGEECFYFYRIANGENIEEFLDDDAKLVENRGENGYNIYSYQDWFDNREVSVDISVEVEGQVFTNNYEENFYLTFLDGYGKTDVELDYFVSNSGLIYVKVPEGKVFCMGDNRGHSTDSRENGFFDKNFVVGRAEFIIYNHNFVNRIWEVIKFYFSEVEKFFAR